MHIPGRFSDFGKLAEFSPSNIPNYLPLSILKRNVILFGQKLASFFFFAFHLWMFPVRRLRSRLSKSTYDVQRTIAFEWEWSDCCCRCPRLSLFVMFANLKVRSICKFLSPIISQVTFILATLLRFSFNILLGPVTLAAKLYYWRWKNWDMYSLCTPRPIHRSTYGRHIG